MLVGAYASSHVVPSSPISLHIRPRDNTTSQGQLPASMSTNLAFKFWFLHSFSLLSYIFCIRALYLAQFLLLDVDFLFSRNPCNLAPPTLHKHNNGFLGSQQWLVGQQSCGMAMAACLQSGGELQKLSQICVCRRDFISAQEPPNRLRRLCKTCLGSSRFFVALPSSCPSSQSAGSPGPQPHSLRLSQQSQFAIFLPHSSPRHPLWVQIR